MTKDLPWGSQVMTSDMVKSERMRISRWGKISLGHDGWFVFLVFFVSRYRSVILAFGAIGTWLVTVLASDDTGCEKKEATRARWRLSSLFDAFWTGKRDAELTSCVRAVAASTRWCRPQLSSSLSWLSLGVLAMVSWNDWRRCSSPWDMCWKRAPFWCVWCNAKNWYFMCVFGWVKKTLPYVSTPE